MGTTTDLYERDFIAWTEQQARVLREAAANRTNLALDWENLIEEVEGLGRSQYLGVASRVARIIEHLLKLEYSPAREPRLGWRATVRTARSEIESRLGNDPGSKPRVADMIQSEGPRAIKLAAAAMADYGEDASAVGARLVNGSIYTQEQILGDWFPGDSAA